MTLDRVHELLTQWGRWAQSDAPRYDPDHGYSCPISPVFEEWLPSQWWKDNGESPPQAIENREAEPNEADAMLIDRAAIWLKKRHRTWLVAAYIRGQYVHWEELQAAQRALIDRLGGRHEGVLAVSGGEDLGPVPAAQGEERTPA